MNAYETAIQRPCYLPEDCANPLYFREVGMMRIGMTVNSGFE